VSGSRQRLEALQRVGAAGHVQDHGRNLGIGQSLKGALVHEGAFVSGGTQAVHDSLQDGGVAADEAGRVFFLTG
jgi:hypothetical protein